LGSASYPDRDALVGTTLIGNKSFLHFVAALGTFWILHSGMKYWIAQIHSRTRLRLQELIQRGFGYAPGGADFFTFEVAFFEGRYHVSFANAEGFGDVGGAEKFGQGARGG
jgi:hypothetical protein